MKALIVTLLPIFVLYGVIYLFAWGALHFYQTSKNGRRSPLSHKLLRAPGQTLAGQVEDITVELNGDLAMLFLLPFSIFSLYLVQVHWGSLKPSLVNVGGHTLIGLATMVFVAKRLHSRLKTRNLLRLGLEAEMAAGQELNHLMLHGCHVFHDFPAEEFNIDHVIVGPSGVLAVETKGRPKPDKGRGAMDAKVIYDGEALRFPDWNETKPLQQAKRQAVWLSKWLSSAIGESVTAKPALALPGWFVERTKPGDVLVFNGRSPQFLAKPGREGQLSPEIIQRISHQLEQRCRDVEPVAYRKENKKQAGAK
ncbi:MAG: nuclease-related domain-containing protein [Desulfuromonadales bacterium]|nr:nuclease-related domain-containing protein [Desulfuromonadales bacterium]MDW7757499.1 nuclease-related domain-containing protein [Desulfuromonadales bacterium]